ncbi:MAG: hypothetical protein JST61_05290 [Acidobacteria bacterium]|nr:hypothetical protein [Acidobacteriota bacterium]
MTPPIGFGTGISTDATATLVPIGTVTPLACDAATVHSASQFADYAYRIAALTAGLALLATFI